MPNKIKNRIFEILEQSNGNDLASSIFDVGIIVLIILNVSALIAETFNLPKSAITFLNYFEIFSVVIFTIEYILRLYTSDLLRPNENKNKARIKYFFSFMALVDLFAILPFYVPFIIPVDLRVLRSLRLVRLFRLFKLNRYSSALLTISNVFKAKLNQLVSSMFVVMLLMLISSILIYNVEHDAQPEAFTNALSGLWWAIATFTTIGYGDIYPVTPAGKVLGAVIGFLGIALVAVPTGIISAGFMEITEKENNNEDKKYCPYCGHKIDD